MREQCLDLRRKYEQAIVAKVVERTDADRIADQNQMACRGIEDGDREVAIQPLGEPLAPGFIRREHARGIARRRREPECREQLVAVVDSAVHHEHDAGSSDKRLDLSHLLESDPEVLAREPNRAFDVPALAVGAPVPERRAHPREQDGIHWAAVEIPETDDAAHRGEVYCPLGVPHLRSAIGKAGVIRDGQLYF